MTFQPIPDFAAQQPIEALGPRARHPLFLVDTPQGDKAASPSTIPTNWQEQSWQTMPNPTPRMITGKEVRLRTARCTRIYFEGVPTSVITRDSELVLALASFATKLAQSLLSYLRCNAFSAAQCGRIRSTRRFCWRPLPPERKGPIRCPHIRIPKCADANRGGHDDITHLNSAPGLETLPRECRSSMLAGVRVSQPRISRANTRLKLSFGTFSLRSASLTTVVLALPHRATPTNLPLASGAGQDFAIDGIPTLG